MGTIGWIIFAVLFGGMAALLLTESEDNKKRALGMVALIILLMFMKGMSVLKEKELTSLSKDVLLTEVPVSGGYVAIATIKITYKNGELGKIELVPATTKKEEK